MWIERSTAELPPWEREQGKHSSRCCDPFGSSTEELPLAHDLDKNKLFSALISRLEKRAHNWGRGKGMGEFDPLLGEKTSVGIMLPFIPVGYSLTIFLQVYKSTLLRWMERRDLLELDLITKSSSRTSGLDQLEP